MKGPDFEKAKQYALKRLEQELPVALTYHSMVHTRDDVIPSIERLAAMEGIEGEELLLLRTAAWYHDIGFIEQLDDHECASVRMAGEILPGFGYAPAQIRVISGIILATKLPQSPNTLLEKIMADADIDSLGREDFLTQSDRLRAELVALGNVQTDEEWYRGQIDFLESHSYFTDSAKTLRSAGKDLNIQKLRKLLAET
ncbi:MAG: phosphohydrolase [Candidatus Aminicenantes bacterium]|nr:MAG: phosphohydrolase [Candidatus Aminicenantes bacterium]